MEAYCEDSDPFADMKFSDDEEETSDSVSELDSPPITKKRKRKPAKKQKRKVSTRKRKQKIVPKPSWLSLESDSDSSSTSSHTSSTYKRERKEVSHQDVMSSMVEAKFGFNWRGPYQIEGRGGEGTFLLSNSKRKRKIFNVENIRTCALPEEENEIIARRKTMKKSWRRKERRGYKQPNSGAPNKQNKLEKTPKKQLQRPPRIQDKKIKQTRFLHEFSSQRKHDIRQLILIREIEISGGGEVISV